MPPHRFSVFMKVLATLTVIACAGHRTTRVEEAHQRQAHAALERFIQFRLEPARLPPPSIHQPEAVATDGTLRGVARLLLAEEAPWNRWPGPTLRLFNNRAAHLFEVRVEAGGLPIRWIPERSYLELNVSGNAFRAAPTAEVLIEELLFWAFQQERALLDGDLVDRARAAGELRRVYLPLKPTTRLEGLIAFPLTRPPWDARGDNPVEPAPYELHVVAMRLTIGLEVDGTPTELVWTFE